MKKKLTNVLIQLSRICVSPWSIVANVFELLLKYLTPVTKLKTSRRGWETVTRTVPWPPDRSSRLANRFVSFVALLGLY